MGELWLLFAVVSTISAGAVSVAVKAGLKDVDSNLGVFLRITAVLVFTFFIVLATKSLSAITALTPKEWIFVLASGLCTGLSWLCYFKALTLGDVNKVVSVDKLSTVLTMILAITVLGEEFGALTFVSMGVMLAGTFLMISKKNAAKNQKSNSVGEKISDKSELKDESATQIMPKEDISDKSEMKDEYATQAMPKEDVSDKFEPIASQVISKEDISDKFEPIALKSMPRENISDKSERKNEFAHAPQDEISNKLEPKSEFAHAPPRKTRFSRLTWFPLAVLSLVFASLTSIFAKVGMQEMPSNLGTFLRTAVALFAAFLIVVGRKKLPEIKKFTKRNWIFILVSGALTCVSWLCYYAAIQMGRVSVVAPIDKLSVLVSAVLSSIFFKERLSVKARIGLFLLVAGTMLLLV